MTANRTCPCGIKFEPRSNSHKYHSEECKNKYHQGKNKLTLEQEKRMGINDLNKGMPYSAYLKIEKEKK